MQDEPRAEVLLEAVQDFLMKEVLPRMEGGTAYKTLVSWNALGMVAREIRDEEGIVDSELKRAETLLKGEPVSNEQDSGGASRPVSLAARKDRLQDLNRRLADRIRARKLHVRDRSEWELVKNMTANRIALVNPRFKLD